MGLIDYKIDALEKRITKLEEEVAVERRLRIAAEEDKKLAEEQKKFLEEINKRKNF